MKQSPHILTFGELLWRLSPVSEQWEHGGQVQMFTGGAEANVAVSLAHWNMPVSFCTRLPEQALSEAAVTCLRSHGVQTGKIAYGGQRMGLYFLSHKNGLSTGEVIYDRKHSAFAELRPGMLDWDRLLADVTWLHWSAISPALNENVAAVCLEALQAARERNIFISTDLNYRNKLWDYGKEPHAIMPRLAALCDLIMGNPWAAEKMLRIPVPEGLDTTDDAQVEQLAADCSRAICEEYAQCSRVAFTFRFSDHPLHNRFRATYYHEGRLYVSRQHETARLTDRIGGGDAFMAGLVYGITDGMPPQHLIEFAAAASFLKLFVPGDFNTTSVAAIREYLQKQSVHL